jgi:hypothetical protein
MEFIREGDSGFCGAIEWEKKIDATLHTPEL